MKNIRVTIAVVLGLCVIVTFAFGRQDGPKRLYVVTYVDVFPAFAADAAAQLRQFSIDSRKDPGAVRFEVMRDVARLNHFSIVEVWENQKAFDAHLVLAHTRQFREKLQAGLGSPFDERLYNIVE